jgi:hypothetical protein
MGRRLVQIFVGCPLYGLLIWSSKEINLNASYGLDPAEDETQGSHRLFDNFNY